MLPFLFVIELVFPATWLNRALGVCILAFMFLSIHLFGFSGTLAGVFYPVFRLFCCFWSIDWIDWCFVVFDQMIISDF